MEKELDRKMVKRLMDIKGEARGLVIKIDWDIILRKEGEKGLQRLEARMAELGIPLKHEDIKTMDFYPLGYDVISVLAMKEIFNYGEKELVELGESEVQISLLLKLFMKHLFSLKILIEQGPGLWRKHYTVGELEVADLNEKKRYLVLRLKNFAPRHEFCAIIRGYFSKALQMMVNSPVSSLETKCNFRGDDYHEFLLRW